MVPALLRALLPALLLCAASASLAQEGFPATLGLTPWQLHEDPAAMADSGGVRVRDAFILPTRTIGGLRFAELSDLAWDEDDGVLYAVSDKGMLFTLGIEFSNDHIHGVRVLAGHRLRDARGRPVKGKDYDSEGLTILNGHNGKNGDAELLVSFEHNTRIARYRPDGTWLADLPLPPAWRNASRYRSPNKTLEGICIDTQGTIFTGPELPAHDAAPGTNDLFALDGRTWHYRSEGHYGLTALACIGPRTLLLLEREFSTASLRVRIRLRRLQLPAAPDDAVLEPTVLSEFDSHKGFQLDNFEGLAHHRGDRYFMVSDDNDMFLQRTLLWYVEIPGAVPTR